MRIPASILICFLISFSSYFSSCSGNHTKRTGPDNYDAGRQASSDTFTLSSGYPDIIRSIVRTDSIRTALTDNKTGKNNTPGKTQKSYDKQGRLIREVKYDGLSDSAGKTSTITSIFDTAGHTIYEDHSEGDSRRSCYRYSFDSSGHMVYKEGYGSGDAGSKTTYIYQGDKLVKVTSVLAGSIKKKE